ncbi:HHIP-like protein 1 [Branchiostoma floridae]|uniref:HHIP-like protein 1 n=1 Tax=Branchiostoma floridae TaxID=7739 RepID=A0A9J7M4N9_BRAFL|nr:HHIP-like protein 1 [Branchiostoma floridae]
MSFKVGLSSHISVALFVCLATIHLTCAAEECPVSTERLAVQNQYPGCVCLQEFASDLRSPVAMLQPDDGTGRFYIVEQLGVVRVADRYGRLRREPLLDLRRRVLTSDKAGDERGLLGMALHPRFNENGYLYVYYTTEAGDTMKAVGEPRTVVSRLNVSTDDENKLKEKVDPRYEKVLLEIEQPTDRNNGGQLLFGPDGFLYITVGDGGAGGDTAGDRSSLLGKILRIDVDGAGPERPYGIPADNPFVSKDLWPDARPEVFALGFRNPWRCSLDPVDDGEHNSQLVTRKPPHKLPSEQSERMDQIIVDLRVEFPKTSNFSCKLRLKWSGHLAVVFSGDGRGRIYCGDVGDSGYEEINIISKGGDHGWPDREGHTCQNPTPGSCAGGGFPISHLKFECNEIHMWPSSPDDIPPIDVYARTQGERIAVIGGVMYRGCGVPDVRGLYLYADYLGLMNKELFYLDEQPNGSWMNGSICVLDNRECVTDLQPSVKIEDHFILAFGQDFDGEVYLLTTTSPVVSQRTGRIFRLVDPRSAASSVAVIPVVFLLSLALLAIRMGYAV